MENFTKLLAWQKAHGLSVETYDVLKDFPYQERFGLANQIQKCSVSISSNIAEGFGRSTPADKEHFYVMSRGSIYELHSQLLLAEKLGYIPKSRISNLLNQINETTRLIQGLINSTRKNRV